MQQIISRLPPASIYWVIKPEAKDGKTMSCPENKVAIMARIVITFQNQTEHSVVWNLQVNHKM